VDRAELPEPGRHPDEALLDEVDSVAQEIEREGNEQDGDDERHDEWQQGGVHVNSPMRLTDWPDAPRASSRERR
jgi:hypothetical protein